MIVFQSIARFNRFLRPYTESSEVRREERGDHELERDKAAEESVSFRRRALASSAEQIPTLRYLCVKTAIRRETFVTAISSSDLALFSPLQRPVSAGGAVPEMSGDGALELRVQRQEEVSAQIFSHLAAEEGSGEATS